VDTYPCPACGGVADADGCRSCGRPYDPTAAALARLNQSIKGIEDEDRRLADGQSELAERRARLQAERVALINTIAQRLATESARAGETARDTAARIPSQADAATTDTASVYAEPADAAPRVAPAPSRATDSRRYPSADRPPQRTPPRAAPPPGHTTRTYPSQALPPEDDSGAETSPRQAQNTLLTLGGVLVGLAAIIITAVFYTTTATGGRAVILAISTTVALSLALLLARRRLTATAETIAGIGLLLVALDGYAAYSGNLAGLRAVPPPLYSAVLLAMVAAVAAAFRLATHLRAPQFATLLAVQPLLPLVAVYLKLGPNGFAAVFAVVAALNLASVLILNQDPSLLLRGRMLRSAQVRRSGAAPTRAAWPRMLRELAWVLFGATLAASVGLSLAGLAKASTVTGALAAAVPLLLAAAVGVAGGRVSGRRRLREIGAGAAALAVIVAVTGVNYQALPEYTLILTAALATAIAVVAGFLPERERRGPQLGSLIGAALSALVVTVSAGHTAFATVRASITPAVWHADLAGYAERVHTSNWQYPATALLLAILAVAATPPSWRVDAAALGGCVFVFAAPGTGELAWWAVPVFAVAVSGACTASSLYSEHGRSALIRSGAGTLLGLYAVATSLARPELTAVVCWLLTAVAIGAATAAARQPSRFGPYADQVADAAGGAAAFTLPIAVGTMASIAGAPARVLLPLTMLATAAGALAAALAQVAARRPRTAFAGGSIAAALGCLILSLRVDGAALADVGLAVLLLAAAGVTAASRAFELSAGGLIEGVRAVPEAVSALVDSVDGHIDRPEPPPGRKLPSIDGITLGAALGTAALIVAMARLLAVAVPGIGLVTTTLMVLIVSLGVRALPADWRRGSQLGAGVVGGATALVTAGVATVEAARVVVANAPFWAADLSHWRAYVGAFAPYGWQVPATLLLAGAAALALLPHPVGTDVGFVAACFAGLAAPASFGLGWAAPIVISGLLGIAAGVSAALVGPHDLPESGRGTGDVGGLAGVAHRRLALAGVLGLYATAAALGTPGSTALVLSAVLAVGVIVASIAQARSALPRRVTATVLATNPPTVLPVIAPAVPPVVAGVAAAASLVAAPGAAATIALASGAGRTGILGAALVLAAFGVIVLAAFRAAQVRWGIYPALAVGLAALTVAIAAQPGGPDAQVWAAAAALVAVTAASTLRVDLAGAAARGLGVPGAPLPDPEQEPAEAPALRDRTSGARSTLGVIVVTAGPAFVLAAIASGPAWLTALFGPYRTLRQVWQGYVVAPVPQDAAYAMVTLILLTLAAATVALTLGGRRYLLAAVLPPLAALALLAPTAVGAPRPATTWVALAIAMLTGLGAALSPPTLPNATRLLRGTAGIVCAVAGAAGLADSLATRSGTLAAIALVLLAAAAAATLGRDPAVRMVAWLVAAAAAFGLPVTALAAAGQSLLPAAFGLLAVCALLIGAAFRLARTAARRPEAGVVELCACLGAAFALLLTLQSPRHAAAVLTVCGLLLGAAALRRDRPADRRQWLVRAALGAEVAACWLLLYSVGVGLTEAYTLPFAAVALLAGALELRRRHDLSSWAAYGPALVGGFLPSVALVLVGQDPGWRWVTLFVAAIATVIVGSVRRRQAPVITGAAVAVGIALIEMIRLLIQGQIAGAVLVAVAGVVLIVFGAVSEQRLRGALRKMS
jgi:hypothetical protein